MKADTQLQQIHIQQMFSFQDSRKQINHSQTDLFQGLDLKCPFSKIAYEYCCEQNCQENAVICFNQDCECKLSHKNCDYFLKVKNFNSKINKKIIKSASNDYLQIEKNTNKIVDKVSEMLDLISVDLKTFGLNQNEKSMKDIIINHFNQSNFQKNKGKQQRLTGENLFKFRAEQKQADQNWFKYSSKHYLDIVRQTKKTIGPLFDEIQNTLTFMHSNHTQKKSLRNYFNNSLVVSEMPGNSFPEIGKIETIINQNLQVTSIRKIYSFIKESKLFEIESTQQNSHQVQAGRIASQKSENQFFISREIKDKNMKQQRFQLQNFTQAVKGRQNLLFLFVNKEGIKYGAYIQCFLEVSHNSNDIKSDSSFLLKLESTYSEKLKGWSKTIKFKGDSLQLGSIRFSQGICSNSGFILELRNGEFFSQIKFEGNPNPNNNNTQSSHGGMRGANRNQNQNIGQSPVLILQVYELQVVKSQKKAQSAEKSNSI